MSTRLAWLKRSFSIHKRGEATWMTSWYETTCSRNSTSTRASMRQTSELFHMSNDSSLFRTKEQLRTAGFEREGQQWIQHVNAQRYLPLYEAKFIWHFDHRFSSYHNLGKVKGRGGRGLPPVTQEEYLDPNFEPEPRYWVNEEQVHARLTAAG